jgi:hypothetical protein
MESSMTDIVLALGKNSIGLGIRNDVYGLKNRFEELSVDQGESFLALAGNLDDMFLPEPVIEPVPIDLVDCFGDIHRIAGHHLTPVG